MLDLKEPSVRYNYKQYVKKLGNSLQSQKAMVVAAAISNHKALPRPEAQVLTVVEQVNNVIVSLTQKLTEDVDESTYCGISMTLLKFLKFKQKYADNQPEVVTGDEMMTVLVQALGEEENATQERILNKVVDLLGENITSLWETNPPRTD